MEVYDIVSIVRYYHKSGLYSRTLQLQVKCIEETAKNSGMIIYEYSICYNSHFSDVMGSIELNPSNFRLAYSVLYGAV